MNVFLNLIKIHIPSYVKKKKLEELFCLAADAFQCKVPETKDRSYRELLERFAAFTRDEVQKAMKSGDSCAALKSRLYKNALSMGEKLRTGQGQVWRWYIEGKQRGTLDLVLQKCEGRKYSTIDRWSMRLPNDETYTADLGSGKRLGSTSQGQRSCPYTLGEAREELLRKIKAPDFGYDYKEHLASVFLEASVKQAECDPENKTGRIDLVLTNRSPLVLRNPSVEVEWVQRVRRKGGARSRSRSRYSLDEVFVLYRVQVEVERLLPGEQQRVVGEREVGRGQGEIEAVDTNARRKSEWPRSPKVKDPEFEAFDRERVPN